MGINSNFVENFLHNLKSDPDQNTWQQVSEKMKNYYGNNIYSSWFRNFHFTNKSQGIIFFSVATDFIKEWILTNYSDKILSFWREFDSSIFSIEINVVDSVNAVTDSHSTSMTPHESPQKPKKNLKVLNPIKQNSDLPINTHTIENINTENFNPKLDKRYTFDTFVTGKPNDLAFAASKKVSENPIPEHDSNPLFLYGGVGLGKTHLMHAIAWNTSTKFQNKKIVYLSAEKFMYQYITSLREKSLMSFKNYLRNIDMLMIDDLQFISGKDNTQEEFFHTFNTLIDQKKQLVISADRSPSNLDGVEERIRSRLGWGLVADINPTTFELRIGILQSKAERFNINISQEVIEFIAQHISKNVRELEGALNKVIAHSKLTNSEINTEYVAEVLSDLLCDNQKHMSIDIIQQSVANYYNLTVTDLKSKSRVSNITKARQIAMYMSKKIVNSTLPNIGKKFGGRDHSTVIHAINKISSLMNDDPNLNKEVSNIIKHLK
ncbi:MAG: chromosomal replication initiator protein DnaA [Candidatus Xenolissoclinum pacificiensis L6]|uniref:Chromosomal replication initiator protein DnaA n=1 Tax=Candidatus Xenolissoclinum pacificiensis L6 TaxID=1401685 RepID=W2V0C6_9RICK|nr:MAG: chromosomal replication initiator protein DnaA [Candidatus Xenolissoclinum pacificiensis L6]